MLLCPEAVEVFQQSFENEAQHDDRCGYCKDLCRFKVVFSAGEHIAKAFGRAADDLCGDARFPSKAKPRYSGGKEGGRKVRKNYIENLPPFSRAVHSGGFKRGCVHSPHTVEHIIPYDGQDHKKRNKNGKGVCFYPYEREYDKRSHGNCAHEVQERGKKLLEKFEAVGKHRAHATENKRKQKARKYTQKRFYKSRAEFFRGEKGNERFKRFLRRGNEDFSVYVQAYKIPYTYPKGGNECRLQYF